ncbi:VOC family protein [Micromonospora sp. KC723]|uniref:bleomycin resistance protein n=1 Tax=Micromonospora sp. KC723 TaxID=2530381 RepID=UPI00104A4508|nr:VOC family protein [Micromonospora sp. KC723]TDB78294.1 VOC family protein [Micromonospora sp. KC723]
MTETMIPILPAKSINDTLDFYRALGFEVTYQQQRPNTYASVRRGGIELHFFVLKDLQPANNWGTCYVTTTDADGLYDAFTAGIRGLLGKVPSRGVPRINPLKDMPFYGVRQFIVVDPAGNYIRIGQPITEQSADASPRSRLERALETGSRLADAKGDFSTAAKVLDGALAADTGAEPALRFRALVLRADIALRLDDPTSAQRFLADAAGLPLTTADKIRLSDDLRRIAELRTTLAGRVPPTASGNAAKEGAQ